MDYQKRKKTAPKFADDIILLIKKIQSNLQKYYTNKMEV